MKVAIIGGGIGGLTTALALKRANIPFKVYESAQELKPVGAGIIIANNAMQVFRYFGIEGEITAQGNRISIMNITKPGLEIISSGNLQHFEKKYGLSNIAIHRASLHHILVDNLGKEHIYLNKKLRSISREKDCFALTFEDGTTAKHEYLIGADGIHSTVRRELFPENGLRDAGQLCWRGVTRFDLQEAYHHTVNEAWGNGKRFGFLRINAQMVYWYFLIKDKYANKTTDILPLLQDFHPVVAQIVKATPRESWFISPIADLKPISKWSIQKACLVGDAAHATTPNLGQGACQAIEDAYVIARLLQQQSIDEAFANYPVLRMKKARYIVNASWQIGNLAHVENKLSRWIRDGILKAMPASINNKQLEKIFALATI
jgi:2-polyprenyl-6-methoxyphenol hydroxylase-like FAD-dependent oxidoreductase